MNLGLDIPFLIRQVSIVTIVALAPVFILSMIPQIRIRVLLTSLTLTALACIYFIVQAYYGNLHIWEGIPPYVPFKAGPSYLSILNIAHSFALFLWLPTLITVILIRFRRNRFIGIGKPISAYGLLAFGFISFVLLHIAFFGTEIYHEDTVISDGFSLSKWNEITVGMTRDAALEKLGPPLKTDLSFLKCEDANAWVMNWSAGYFAVLWFKNSRIERKHMWYSD